MPPVFGGLAARDPAGGWQRPPNLAGVDPVTAQIHLWSRQRALLVAREGSPEGPGRRRLVVADGQTDGGFGRAAHARAVHGRDVVGIQRLRRRDRRLHARALAVHRGLRAHRTAAASARRATWRSGARRRSPSTLAAIACSPGRPARRIGVRVRRAGESWSRRPAHRPRCRSTRNRRLSALVAPDGRMLITWGRDRGNCGVAVRDGRGTWRTATLERRCGPAAVGAREAPVLPLVDSSGATYVAWTHGTRQANSVTLARVGPAGPVSRSVVSRQRGAMLDDVAAGPDGAIAVTWAAVLSKENPLLTATYAGLRRSGAGVRGPAAVAAERDRRARQPRRVSSADGPGRRRDPVRRRPDARRRLGDQPARHAVAPTAAPWPVAGASADRSPSSARPPSAPRRGRRAVAWRPCPRTPTSCSAPSTSWRRSCAAASCRRSSSSSARCGASTRCEPGVNAFVDVDHDGARAAAARDRARRPAPVRRRADRDQEQPRGPRPAADALRRPHGRRRRRARPQRRAAAARRGLRRRRHDDAARVGDPAGHRAAALRPDAQPVGPRAHARRLVRRLGGGRRRRHGPDRPRQRRRRLAAHPRRVLRPRRPQAGARARLARHPTPARASSCRTAS